MSSKGPRGRTSITDSKAAVRDQPKGATGPNNDAPHRVDRRDMNKLYTGNEKHASRGNDPRPDVSTRKR